MNSNEFGVIGAKLASILAQVRNLLVGDSGISLEILYF